MYRVALTGNIASGKSAVASVWESMGAAIIDADQLAREAVAPGSVGLASVLEAFGSEVAAPDGSLDRAALRRRIFEDDAQRRRLERLLHPEIARLGDEREARLGAAGERTVVHMIPLLFETGKQDDFDLVALVDAPESVRLGRLVRDRDLTESEAQAMIESQMPSARKRLEADLVIRNDGTLEDLEAAARAAWRKIEQTAS